MIGTVLAKDNSVMVFGMILIAASCLVSLRTDARSRIIPDALHILGLVGVFLWHRFQIPAENWISCVACLCVLLTLNVMLACRGKSSAMLGGGDIKLVSWLGLLLGRDVVAVVAVSVVLAWVYLVVKRFRIHTFPFAWCVWGGFWTVLMFGGILS